jgi:hypothetical protein
MPSRNGDLELKSFRQRYAHLSQSATPKPEDVPLDCAGAASEVLSAAAAGRTAIRSIEERLTLKFGLGNDGTKRRKLYQRLERLVEREGERALVLISEAVAQAVGARDPGRYFCRAVVSKIRDSGLSLTGGAGGDARW